jgi:hypothetical protein
LCAAAKTRFDAHYSAAVMFDSYQRLYLDLVRAS